LKKRNALTAFLFEKIFGLPYNTKPSLPGAWTPKGFIKLPSSLERLPKASFKLSLAQFSMLGFF
jgi:hypothetical protein